MSRDNFVFHSALAPDAVIETLRRTTDTKREALFSFTRRGTRQIRSLIGTNAFILRRRRYLRGEGNDFTRRFYARISPESGGTRIEAYFDLPPFAIYFMRVWLTAMVLIGTFLFMTTLSDIVRGRHVTHHDIWLNFVAPPAIVLGGILLSKFDPFLRQLDEDYILQYVQEKLVARMVVAPPPRTGKFRWIRSLFEI